MKQYIENVKNIKQHICYIYGNIKKYKKVVLVFKIIKEKDESKKQKNKKWILILIQVIINIQVLILVFTSNS